MDEVSCEGARALHISARKESLASWRTTVLLPRGQYRFEDRVRVAGVEALPTAEPSGARVRVSGSTAGILALAGDSAWQNLAADFEVGQPVAKVELICELRARAGQAWFDLAALRVLKMDTKL